MEFLAIFENIFASIPVGEAQIEDSLAVEVGNAAESRAEAVDEPGEFLESVEFENFQVASGTESPGL